jgi:hypothetical protein
MRIHQQILLCTTVLILSGCTLIARPDALTTLQLTLPTATANAGWPDGLTLGNVRAVSALESNRVLVVEGATLMQHQGLRWAESPAILLAEQLQLRRVRAIEGGARSADRNARLDVWLSRFDLQIEADGTQAVRVALSAELKCLRSEVHVEFPPVEHSQSPTTTDAQGLAEAFSLATGRAVDSVLGTVRSKLQSCAAAPDR